MNEQEKKDGVVWLKEFVQPQKPKPPDINWLKEFVSPGGAIGQTLPPSPTGMPKVSPPPPPPPEKKPLFPPPSQPFPPEMAEIAKPAGKYIKEGAMGGLKRSGAISEAAISGVSGLGSFLPALAGGLFSSLYQAWKTGGRDVDFAKAEGFMHKIMEIGTYQPKIPEGEEFAQTLMAPFAHLDAMVTKKSERFFPDDPNAQAAFRMATWTAMVVFGGKAKGKAKALYKDLVKGELLSGKDMKYIFRESIKDLPPDFVIPPDIAQKIVNLPDTAKVRLPKSPETLYKFLSKDDPQLFYDIRDVTSGQGIRPNLEPGGKGKFRELEEWKGIPNKIKSRKSEFPIDIVRDQLNREKGYNFDTDVELRAALEGKKPKPGDAEIPMSEVEAQAKAFNEAVARGEVTPELPTKPTFALKQEQMKKPKGPEPIQVDLEMQKPKVTQERLIPEEKVVKRKERVPKFGEKEGYQIGISDEVSPKLKLGKKVLTPEEQVAAFEAAGKVEKVPSQKDPTRGELVFEKGEGLLDTTRNEYAEALETTPESLKTDLPYDKWQRQEVGGFVGEGKKRPLASEAETKKTFGNLGSRLYQNVIDKFHSIEKLRDIYKKEGHDLPVMEDPFINVRLFAGIQGKAETKIFHRRFKIKEPGNVEWGGKSLAEIVKPVKKDIADFDKYLIYRRVPELERLGVKTGVELREAVEFVKSRPQFKKPAIEVTEYLFSLLDEMVASGRVEKSFADSLKDKHRMYVKFERVLDSVEKDGYVPTGKNLLTKIPSNIFKMKGSEKVIISPLESAIKATYIFTSLAERNIIANQIVNMRKLSPRIAEIIKPVKPKLDITFLEDGTKIFRLSKKQHPNVIEVYTEGKRHFYEVPKELYESMSQMSEVEMGMFWKILALPARALRTGATATPEFAFRNPIRDQTTTYINAKYGYVPGWDFAKGLFSLVKKPDLYWKWQASGAPWSQLVTLDRATNQARLKKVLGRKDYSQYIKDPIKILENLSMYSETPTRLGIFGRAKKKGAPDIMAAYESRRSAVDFAVRGKSTKIVSSLYTFANARLQAVTTFAKTIKENPAKAMLRITSIAVIPSIVNYLVNKNDPYYWEIPEWDRDIFWHVPLFRFKTDWNKLSDAEKTLWIVNGGTEKNWRGKWFRLRMPKGDAGVIFGTTTEKILQFIDQDRKGAIELNKLAAQILQEVSPISDLGGVFPTFARPIVENIANKNFFLDRPIVTMSQARLAPQYQHSIFTSETAKVLGKVFKYSPSKIENLIVGWGGGLARHGLKLNDIALREMGIAPEKIKQPLEASDIPVVKAFATRDPLGFGSESVNDFYTILGKIETFYSTRNKLTEQGQIDELRKYTKKHPVEANAITVRIGDSEDTLDKIFRRVQRNLSTFRKLKERIALSKEVSVEKKKQVYDEIHAMVMLDVIGVLYQYRNLEARVKKMRK